MTSLARKKERLTPRRAVAVALFSLIPLAAIGMGVGMLIAHTLFSVMFAVTYLLLPVGALLLLFLLLTGRVRRGWSLVLSIVLLSLFSFLFLLLSSFGTYEMLDHKKNEEIGTLYAEVADDFACMPSLEEIGSPVHVDYYDYFLSEFAIFTCDADALICRYTDDAYEDQKVLVEKTYVFQEAPMTALEYTCEPTAQIDGYTFRTVAIEDVYGKDIQYPKRMVFIATNDTTHKIVYMSFYNDDLDYILSLETFILENCGFRHMR